MRFANLGFLVGLLASSMIGWAALASELPCDVPLSRQSNPADNDVLELSQFLDPKTQLVTKQGERFVRHPADRIWHPKYFEIYVANSIKADAFFGEFWRNGRSTTDFAEVLRRQHELLTTATGKYFGYLHAPETQNPYPGKFCFEVIDTKTTHESANGKLVEIQYSFYLPGLAQGNRTFRIDVDAIHSREGEAFKTNIDGVPADVQPLNVSTSVPPSGPRYMHFYPPPEVQKTVYLPLIKRRFRELVEAFEQGADPEKKIEAIARYYEVGVNSQIFVGGNNSMFMLHVNFFLKLMGKSPVPHGNLDIQAITQSTDQFVTSFKGYVEANAKQ